MVVIYFPPNLSVAMSAYNTYGESMMGMQLMCNPISWVEIAYPASLLTPKISQILVAVDTCHIELVPNL